MKITFNTIINKKVKKMKNKIIFLICIISLVLTLIPSTQALVDIYEINEVSIKSKNRMTYFYMGRITNLSVDNSTFFGDMISFEPIRVRFIVKGRWNGGKMFYAGRFKNLANKIYLPPNPSKTIGIIRDNFICAFFIYNFEEESDENGATEKVELNSNLVELVYGRINKNLDDGIVESVDVKYLFKNLLDREITISISAEFLDENNNSLAIVGNKTITLPPNYEEKKVLPVSPQNTINYAGEDAAEVDHVKLIVYAQQ
jgi:hypothetical protein